MMRVGIALPSIAMLLVVPVSVLGEEPWFQNTKKRSTSACGIPPTSRIVGGGEATPYSIPWQVAFVRRGSDSPNCGGTLITDRHVLTAAHCTRPLGYEGEIIVGEHDITSSEDGTRHSYSRYVDHPLYESNTANYDFSIIYLDKPVQIGPRAVPACLPSTDFSGDYLNGKNLTVSGWGALSEGGLSPTVLHSVEVPGMTNAICNQPDFYNNRITDVMLCAGYAGGEIDSCQGDSGGPLTYESEGQTFIVGVVSWGIGCARENKPGVYARVTEVLPWINDQIDQIVGSECEEGWELFEMGCYKIPEDFKNHTDAENDCMQKGGHLTSVHSKGEVDFLLRLIGGPNSPNFGPIVILGGTVNTDEDQVSSFHWTDGSDFDYYNWSPGQPQIGPPGIEQCIGMTPAFDSSEGTLIIYPCVEDYKYICKKPFEVPCVTNDDCFSSMQFCNNGTCAACNSGWFDCDEKNYDYYCIKNFLQCDGINNCPNKNDEKDCPAITEPPPTTVTPIDSIYSITNNNGPCCVSDNVFHEFCMVTNNNGFNLTLPGLQPGFDLSQCEKRCSNDPFCKGYTKLTSNYNESVPDSTPIVFSFDTCFLFTNSSTSSFCTHSQDFVPGIGDDNFGIGPLNPNAICSITNEDPALSTNYYEGCHIKTEDVLEPCTDAIKCQSINQADCKYHSDVQELCPKKCGVCNKVATTTQQPCEDVQSESYCRLNKRKCRYIRDMAFYCRKTCGLC